MMSQYWFMGVTNVGCGVGWMCVCVCLCVCVCVLGRGGDVGTSCIICLNLLYTLNCSKSKLITVKSKKQEKGTLLHCWWECKLVQQLWRTVWKFLKKLEIELPYDWAIPLLGIHTEETRIERDTCTSMFIAALFIIARTWKQPRCPSADEWIRKLWYIDTMEYYSAIKKNTFESVLMRWMKLEPIIQSEVSQKEKHQYSILTHIYGI